MAHQFRELQHIQETTSHVKTIEKKNSMKQHFNYFCIHHYKRKPESNEPYSLDQLTFTDITSDICGKFASYLVQEARVRCTTTNKKLAWQTIQGYYSSYKTFIINKFHANGIPPALSDETTKRQYAIMIRDKLRQLQESEDNTEELFGSSKEMTTEDEGAIASLCIWNGDKDSAEFWHLIRSMISNLGRGSEVSVSCTFSTCIFIKNN